MILGLVWTMICHFQFAGLDMKAQKTAKGAVLEWANALGVKITNVTTDFEDGKVLCQIVDSLRPGDEKIRELVVFGSFFLLLFLFLFCFVFFFFLRNFSFTVWFS
jgi:hypothetical protein